jgi:hypothetical protein
VAECVYVLESFYEVPRARVAELMRAATAVPTIEVMHEASLLRALEVYELERMDFAEAYLVAQAEATGVSEILSFDRSIDRVTSITRREPSCCSSWCLLHKAAAEALPRTRFGCGRCGWEPAFRPLAVAGRRVVSARAGRCGGVLLVGDLGITRTSNPRWG